MPLTYLFLGLAIPAVWLPSVPIGRFGAVPPWGLLFVAAIGTGVDAGVLTAAAVVSLGITWALLATHRHDPRSGTGQWALALACGLVLALALHQLPGFRNTVLNDALRVGHGTVPFTQSLKFDKGAAGLLLLAMVVPRVGSVAELRALMSQPRLAWIAVGTPVLVMGAASLAGMVRPDFRLPAMAAWFLAFNLLFTCVAEEAFFRGLLQERLAGWAGGRAGWGAMPVAVSTVLFALAHLGGGLAYAMFAALAGLGYALAYAVARRTEAAIAVHFLVNAVHFLLFTHPAAVR